MLLAPGAILASRYRIVRLLGRGGMGAVYRAQHIHTGERVALKVLLQQHDVDGGDAQTLERFRREMRAPARIRSEHVVRVSDADVATEIGGAPFLVMELLDGCDLDKLLRTRGMLPPEEVVWIFHQIAGTLDKAHALGVVHRDLKPGNLFLHKAGSRGLLVKLLDFGIARITQSDGSSPADPKLTSTGALLGTPSYMSPEQVRGQSDQLGPASDIWSLGHVVFQLLTGRCYFQAGTVAELIGQILFAPMHPASTQARHLPRTFDSWFARSCARDPTERWPSTTSQVRALAAALGLAATAGGEAAPKTLVAAVDALRGPESAGQKDADGEGAPGHTAPSTPDTAALAGPRSPSVRRLRHVLPPAVAACLLPALVAMSRLGNPMQPPQHSPPRPHHSPFELAPPASPTRMPAADTVRTPDPAAFSAGLVHRADPTSALRTTKSRRRPSRPSGSASSVSSGVSITASGFDPEGR
ncbi:serine/threonine-protein kinase [Haliangium sp. UPWRP_2]|uniref:serine/threonine-protein kinase n=1 Tax=Haliangium sp. UPWRP_2 TaxID=1931276 RepID=UPI000B544501|nr:serine/threonine-protein kinase [Haliangium sp. UPWRP_2]PSM31647.1 serine/threonine protein kinase [Haliangium sp. UPWRP_2]